MQKDCNATNFKGWLHKIGPSKVKSTTAGWCKRRCTATTHLSYVSCGLLLKNPGQSNLSYNASPFYPAGWRCCAGTCQISFLRFQSKGLRRRLWTKCLSVHSLVPRTVHRSLQLKIVFRIAYRCLVVATPVWLFAGDVNSRSEQRARIKYTLALVPLCLHSSVWTAFSFLLGLLAIILRILHTPPN